MTHETKIEEEGSIIRQFRPTCSCGWVGVTFYAAFGPRHMSDDRPQAQLRAAILAEAHRGFASIVVESGGRAK